MAQKIYLSAIHTFSSPDQNNPSFALCDILIKDDQDNDVVASNIGTPVHYTDNLSAIRSRLEQQARNQSLSQSTPIVWLDNPGIL